MLEEAVKFGLGGTPRTEPGSKADFSKAKEEKQSALANLVMSTYEKYKLSLRHYVTARCQSQTMMA